MWLCDYDYVTDIVGSWYANASKNASTWFVSSSCDCRLKSLAKAQTWRMPAAAAGIWISFFTAAVWGSNNKARVDNYINVLFQIYKNKLFAFITKKVMINSSLLWARCQKKWLTVMLCLQVKRREDKLLWIRTGNYKSISLEANAGLTLNQDCLFRKIVHMDVEWPILGKGPRELFS